jgi:hypothetical protein
MQMRVPESLEIVIWIIMKGSGNSRNSGNLISVDTEILCWSRNSGPVFSILTISCACSRTSGQGCLDRNESTCAFQNF